MQSEEMAENHLLFDNRDLSKKIPQAVFYYSLRDFAFHQIYKFEKNTTYKDYAWMNFTQERKFDELSFLF